MRLLDGSLDVVDPLAPRHVNNGIDGVLHLNRMLLLESPNLLK